MVETEEGDSSEALMESSSLGTNPLPQIPPCWTFFVNVELQVAESANLIRKTHDGERSVSSKTK